ncbi:MAG: hypothetical protein PHP00_09940 [Thiotrichaceae bacterium]|nr:hypothetical protein [Thiotrichaceae bacterium]
MSFNFGTQNQVGKQGELVILDWLKTRYDIRDVSCEPTYQKAGVDFLVMPSGVKLEVKTDAVAKRTHNLFFETVSVRTANQKDILGWGLTSTADYLLYLLPEQELLIIPLEALRGLFERIKPNLHEKTVPNKGYQTLGYPIKLEHLRKIAEVRNCPLVNICDWEIKPLRTLCDDQHG